MNALGTQHPIMQAPLGRAGGTALALAVTRAGGLGTLGASYTNIEVLREQIRTIREATDLPFCVNLILAFPQRERLKLAIQEGAPCISFSWGIDTELIDFAHAGAARVLVQVATESEAREASASGADALIVQGVEAGGHVQAKASLLTLIEQIKRQTSAPLVAAGGIADPSSARRALEAGVAAIAMGTRFVASNESLAHPRYRQRLLEATAADTVLTDLFDVGWPAPHRVLRNHVYETWEAAGKPPPGQRPGENEPVALAPFGRVPRYAVNPPIEGMEGDVEAMAMYAGQGVGDIGSVESAPSIIKRFAAAIGPV